MSSTYMKFKECPDVKWDPNPFRTPSEKQMQLMSIDELRDYQKRVQSAISFLEDHDGQIGNVIFKKEQEAGK